MIPASTDSPRRERPPLALIAAIASNGVIGADNGLPWKIPEDLTRFRTLTTGHAVIMGRKTWSSIGRPLPGRQNIVVTRQAGLRIDGVAIADSLDAALGLVSMPEPAFCIGGAELYALALPMATRMYLTEIAREFAGDAHFPPFDKSEWTTTAEQQCTSPAGLRYAFVDYERAKASLTRRG